MKPSRSEEGLRWLAQARKDLDAARLLAGGGHHNLACFHAQQGAEKAVKGFLYAQETDEVWGHSVAKLLRDASTFDDTLDDSVTLGALLDKFYIPTRYPNGLPGGIPSEAYNAQESRQALEWAGKVVLEVAQRIS
jgi:HEPN domain-containing protein